MADEKKISNAPVITPLRGGLFVQSRTPATAPKWAYWPASRHVAPWQAVALSLNFQPWADRPQNFYPDIFPDADTETKFKLRYDLMLACLQSRNAMLLSDFAAWAMSVNLVPLPDELTAMAPKADNAAETKESPEQRRIRLRTRRDELKRQNVRGWQQKIADEEGISVPRLKQLLSLSSKQAAKSASPFASLKSEKAKKAKSATG